MKEISELIYRLHDDLIREIYKNMELNNSINKMEEHKKKIIEYVRSFDSYIPEDNVDELLYLIGNDNE